MEDNKERIELPHIDEFHFDYALSLVQEEELLYGFLLDYQKTLETVPQKLEMLYAEILQEAGVANYRCEVHALKSTSATVGALILSQLARLLEVAAIEKNLERIHTLHPILMEELAKHKARIDEAFPIADVEETVEVEAEYLDMLMAALQMEDYSVADFLIAKIKEKRYSEQMQMWVDALAGQVFNLQVQDALNTIEIIKG